MRTRRSGHRRALERAFTLIELVAVTLLIALLAAVAIPNLGLRGSRVSLQEAESLAALLEFGRQRAVMTGQPQRVVVDLDAQRYWLESLSPPQVATGEPVEGWAALSELPLAAPRGDEALYLPAPGPPGRPRAPAAGVWLAAIETEAGREERGQVALPFAADGSSEATDVWLTSEAGHRIVLSLSPMADRIRIARLGG